MAKKKLKTKVKSRTKSPKKTTRKTAPARKPKQKSKPTRKSAPKRKSKKVSPIPKGYHNVTPYLMVSDASQAIEFYKKAFGAKEVMRFNGPEGKITHAEIQIGDSKIMLSDMYNQHNPSSSASIHLYMKDVDAVIAKATAAGAALIFAVEDKFYGDRSGMVTDPFGHHWNIATHIEDLSKKEVNKRAQAFGKDLLELTTENK